MINSIYCLVDDRTGIPFYVGATKHPIKNRLAGHLSAARSKGRSRGCIQRRIDFINEILSAGSFVRIYTLLVVNDHNVDVFERFFYNFFTSQSIELHQDRNLFNYQKCKTDTLFPNRFGNL